MPRLKPLEEWLCDACGEVIEHVSHGTVVFKDFRGSKDKPPRAGNYRIVHRWGQGPRGPKGCAGKPEQDEELETLASNSGMWLAHLCAGRQLTKSERRECHSLLEWTEMYRRLYIAYYEEARLYFTQAEDRGLLDGMNEITLVRPEFLLEIITEFE